MRDGWTETTLGEVAEVLDRMRKPISSAEREKRMGDVPYYGATGQAGWIDKPIFDEELVLLGEDAIDFLNPDVHKAYLISGPSWVNNHAHVLRAKREIVLSFFLMEALNAVDYSQFVSFGTRSKLTQGAMMGISLQVPPLVEQKRIVDLVSSVDSYIDSLQQQVDTARTARNAVLNELLESIPGAPKKKLKDLTSKIGSGATPRGGEAVYQKSGVALIRSQNVHNGRFVHEGLVSISDSAARSLDGVSVEGNDVLINITGASVARACLVDERILPARVNQHVAILRANDNQLLPGFLLQILLGRDMNSYLLSISGSGTTRQAITKAQLDELEVSVPPLGEQRRIVEIVSSMDDVIRSTEQAVVEAKNLRSGLLSDLLSGNRAIPESYDSLLEAA